MPVLPKCTYDFNLSLPLSHTNHTHLLTHSLITHKQKYTHVISKHKKHTLSLCNYTHVHNTHKYTHALFHTQILTHGLLQLHTLSLQILGVISEDCGDKVMLPLRIQVLPKCTCQFNLSPPFTNKSYPPTHSLTHSSHNCPASSHTCKI
ncbi:hypothetical protein GBAR_LOCUS17211 [Geodia barretti]|uniref:Uncharacterized protein n=1 Tax=Geodia barretti TaxID=519541 RepID=A0AA35SJ16_GEOBA|nr:hypothetical protein GBAR_LOCUS17211 [Geodia barretti]